MKNQRLQHLTPKQKKIFGGIVIGAFLIFMTLVTVFIGPPLIKFIKDPDVFRSWVDSHGLWGRILFIGMIVFQVIFAIIPGEPLEIGAGYAFGAVEGTILCILGTTVGGVLVFLGVKKFGTRLVEIFFPMEKIRSLWFLRTAKRRNLITFLVFCIPGTPKDLLCYFVGLTDMKLGTWILISAVARIPSVITSTIGGNALGNQEYTGAVIALAVTALVSGFGILAYRKIIKPKRDSKKHSSEEQTEDL